MGETTLAPNRPQSARNAVASVRGLNTPEIKRRFAIAGQAILASRGPFFFGGQSLNFR